MFSNCINVRWYKRVWSYWPLTELTSWCCLSVMTKLVSVIRERSGSKHHTRLTVSLQFVDIKVKSLLSHMGPLGGVISVSLALSHSPAYTMRPQMRGSCITWFASVLPAFAGGHCTDPQRDGQAELTWVVGSIQDGLSAHRWLLITVLTRPNVEQLHCGLKKTCQLWRTITTTQFSRF